MSTQIRYKKKPVVTFESGTVTLKTEDFGLEGDIEVASEGGSGECSGEHVIEVETLPTTNIDENALYKVGDTYYRYAEAFRDMLIVQYGQVQSFVEAFAGMGVVLELYYVKTRPTENIVGSSDELWALYYVEDENDVLAYGDFDGSGTNVWVSFITSFEGENGGAITDISQATQNGAIYALVDNGWKEYLAPSGSVTVTENTIVDVREKATVVVNVLAPPDSPLPIKISNETEMNALLSTADVGSIYKYIGTTGTYENGALYVVEAVT
jgi:hypothetical protein